MTDGKNCTAGGCPDRFSESEAPAAAEVRFSGSAASLASAGAESHRARLRRTVQPRARHASAALAKMSGKYVPGTAD
jgi:hypothetical protein